MSEADFRNMKDKTKYGPRYRDDYNDDDSFDQNVVEGEVKDLGFVTPPQSARSDEGDQEVVFSKWKNYSDTLNNLTQKNNIKTAWPIISLMITYDSSRVIAVTKKNDTEYFIR